MPPRLQRLANCSCCKAPGGACRSKKEESVCVFSVGDADIRLGADCACTVSECQSAGFVLWKGRLRCLSFGTVCDEGKVSKKSSTSDGDRGPHDPSRVGVLAVVGGVPCRDRLGLRFASTPGVRTCSSTAALVHPWALSRSAGKPDSTLTPLSLLVPGPCSSLDGRQLVSAVRRRAMFPGHCRRSVTKHALRLSLE